VHESNARNLCIAILISTSKNALSFFKAFIFCLLFNKIRDKGRTALPGSEAEWGSRGRNGPNNACAST
jgi:hypothetical protein